MKGKEKFKSISGHELENPKFRKLFEETWPLFQLEAQAMLSNRTKKYWKDDPLAGLWKTSVFQSEIRYNY